jgi:hypothetical protein
MWTGWSGKGRRSGRWSQWVSLASRLKAPVLLGFHAAHEARQLEALNDKDTVAHAHEALRNMFGSRFPAPQAAQITRWGRDPFSLGSYSFNAVGSSVQHVVAGAHGVVVDLARRAFFVAEFAVVGAEDAPPGAVLVVHKVRHA